MYASKIENVLNLLMNEDFDKTDFDELLEIEYLINEWSEKKRVIL